MSNAKNILLSKTLWINVFAIGGAFLTELSGLLGTEGTITALAAVNILLRLVTKEAVRLLPE